MNSRAKRAIVPLAGAVIASGVVGASLTTTAEAQAKPRTKTVTLAKSAAEATAIVKAWTPAKLKAAKSYTEELGVKGKLARSVRPAKADGPAGSVPPIGASSSGSAKNVNLPRTVGKVFFEIGGEQYWCSATSIQSKYRNLVATAGHCAYDTDTNTATKQFVFIPSYHQGKAPYGVYVGYKLNFHSDFDVFEDYDRDYAFINVYNGIKPNTGPTKDFRPVDVGRLGDNVGGQGFTWNRNPKSTYFTFGYPAGAHLDGDKPYSGNTMKWCYGTSSTMPAAPEFNVQEHLGFKCAFTPGASGGPWLYGYRNSTRVGYVGGVNSLVWDTDGNGRYDRVSSPYFDGETYSVYKAAANLWSPVYPGAKKAPVGSGPAHKG
ncbi:trypsin-like serine peptidase [Bailinhaonella thermotolerans]|uniref:Serine protease n=1 Tax=Bailinhaonella thermotolerans TaxID=1070861 RepID=A0A3A4ABF5_9ACTN|nr:trypsin-like serine protease [Bailinhaonella thermotolerans]RJL26586.1 serine protease [Bailinhaonella thermotolerans]